MSDVRITHAAPSGATAGWQSPFKATDRGSRELRTWQPRHGSLDSELEYERRELVAKARDLSRNNAHAAGLQLTQLDNVVGIGWRLQAQPDWRFLGQKQEWRRGWTRRVEALWRQHAMGTGNWIDASRRTNFAGLLGMSLVSWWDSGDVFSQLPWIERPGSRYATTVQMIDPSRVSNPNNAPDRPLLRAGLALDGYGATLGFHIRAAHPGDLTRLADHNRWEYVPRETAWGRPNMLHFFEVLEDGQTRGLPPKTAVLESSRLIDIYGRTEVSAAILNAMFAAVLKTQFHEDPSVMREIMGVDEDGNRLEGRPEFELKIDGIQIPDLPPGHELQFVQAQRPAAAFADFERAVIRRIAAGAGISYEQVAKDWSQTNYSSARASLIEAWKRFMVIKSKLEHGFATPIYAAWLEEAIDKGDVEMPADAPGFYEARDAWCACRWIGPGRGQIDPVKETQPAGMRVDELLTSRTDEAAAYGRDLEDIVIEQSDERDMFAEYGVTPQSTARAPVVARSDMEDERTRR